MPLPAILVTAPAPMSSSGWFIALIIWRWAAESVRVIVVELASKVLVAISSRVRPPVDRPVSRTAIRS